MFALRKAENRHVDIVLTIRVAPPAERQLFCLAEDVDPQVLVADAAIRRKRDLVRPISIHHRFAEFAFTIDHRPLQKWSPPALTRRPGGRTRPGAELAGGVDSGLAE
jgi:hypothetical protein